MGLIARSDTGEFVDVAAGKLQFIRSALQAETEDFWFKWLVHEA
jgi:hypothetical protein